MLEISVELFKLAHAYLLAIPTFLVFIFNCFIKPIGSSSQQSDRLDKFYKSQAAIYDASRDRLLQGRQTMLKLAAAALKGMSECTLPYYLIIFNHIPGLQSSNPKAND